MTDNNNRPNAAVMPRAVAELFEHMSRSIHSMSFSAGLNPAQWNALRFVARATPSARTMTAFAAFHRTTKSTASQTISALVRKRLIRKIPDGEDGRVVRLDLTPKGLRLLQHDPVNHLVDALSTLSANELSAVATAVERMTRAVFTTRPAKTKLMP